MLYWLLWSVVILGGGCMAVGYGIAAWKTGFEISATANSLLYGVCAVYAFPKFVRFVLKK